MATIRSAFVDHSLLDDTGDDIGGAEVDANPYLLADILDGTTATQLNQSGSMVVLNPEVTDISVAAGGIRTALRVRHDPASGTVTAGDGPRILFEADDNAGNKTTLGSINFPWVTVTDGATEAANFELTARVAGATPELVSVGTDGFIFNETGVDLDYRFESDTNANAFTLNSGLFGGVGGIGLAAAATAAGVVLIDPPALTADANTNIARLNIENTAAITVPAGTTSIAASLFIGEPNLTATGTITSAVTLYIEGAPTEGGTNNYALWVDAGVSAFGGNVVPDANDVGALGTTTLGWSDLHLATGGVINWANGEVTITETDGNTLTIAGVATRLDLAAGILEMNNAIEWDTGVAVVAAEYSVGRDADGTNQLHFNVPTGASMEWSINDASKIVLTSGGALLIGDTANANMTVGLTINQGSAANEMLAFKSAITSHPFTDYTEADTQGIVDKANSSAGGLKIDSFTDSGVGSSASMQIRSFVGATVSTNKTTSAEGALLITSRLTDGGTGATTIGADGNLMVLQNYTTTRFIWDAEGSGHADVEWTTFDAYDDIALITDIEQELLRSESPGQSERRHYLEATGVIGKDSWHFEKGKPRAMINFTRLAMVHHGALIQVGERFAEEAKERQGLREEIASLKTQLRQLAERN